MIAAQFSILSQAPVTETQPTNIPLQRFPTSNLEVEVLVLKMYGLKTTTNKPATALDNKVLRIIFGAPNYLGVCNDNVLPPLKNSHATHKMIVPRAIYV